MNNRPNVRNYGYQFDPSHPSIKKIIDKYIDWNRQNNDDIDEATATEDILYCFAEFDDDGYKLAKALEDKIHIDADSNLVDILDDVSHAKHQIQASETKKWVEENNLTIDPSVMNREVTVKTAQKNWGVGKLNQKFIGKIYPNEYQVGICENIDDKSRLYIVNFEDIIFSET